MKKEFWINSIEKNGDRIKKGLGPNSIPELQRVDIAFYTNVRPCGA